VLPLFTQNDPHECTGTDVEFPFYVNTARPMWVKYGNVRVPGSVFRMGDDPRTGRHIIASRRRWLLSRRTIRIPYTAFARRREVSGRNVQLSVTVTLKIGVSVSVVVLFFIV